MNSSNDDNKSKLNSFVERIEKYESEKKDISDLIKDVYSEVRNDGFDVKIVRKLIKLMRLTKQERENELSLLELYMKEL